ncbi:MAG TPA: alkaline phosphatase D family protein [Coleofasciculaceae cyanobacterium]
MERKNQGQITRRSFLLRSALTGGSIIATDLFSKSGLAQVGAPAIIRSATTRPNIPYGVASGDITSNSAIVWSRTDRPARMVVDYDTTESFRNPKRLISRDISDASDYSARVNLTYLPPNQQIFYRVTFEDLNDRNIYSTPVTGTFRTPSANRRDIFFAWSGDTAGQGWGINREFGGMKIYETMRRLNPDFFIHSGDTIYADGPIPSEVKLDDGRIWKNVTTPEKSKVAETLAEFRGNYIYNLLDENVRRFNAQVPQLVQWDDHEVRNNWYPGQVITNDDRYKEKNVDILSARARQAFLEYQPIRFNSRDPKRIYRSFNYGPSLEIFMLDERSYRGPNSPNRQPVPGKDTAFLGNSQIGWLKEKLLSSRAVWKVIASDMPLGLIVPDGSNFENSSNGDSPPLGREFEIADLLSFIKQKNIRNVVWLTADVHYAAAHYYDPNKAQFTNFKPFWEFVAGPLNAGTFGPSQLDNTFGPQVKFNSIPANLKPNRPPSDGLQFFGTVKIEGTSQVMTVAIHNLEGKVLYSVDLPPET